MSSGEEENCALNRFGYLFTEETAILAFVAPLMLRAPCWTSWSEVDDVDDVLELSVYGHFET